MQMSRVCVYVYFGVCVYIDVDLKCATTVRQQEKSRIPS